MITSLYDKYFQKSRSFLFPALGIKKEDEYNPTGTYIALEGFYEPDDVKLICSYKLDHSQRYKDFEDKALITNPLYYDSMVIQEFKLYVFDYSHYDRDWFNFLLGKYSKFSTMLKKAIKAYYGERSDEYRYIDSFIYPQKYYEVYARLLDVNVEDLKEIGELCSPCDLDKETLKIPADILESLKKDV